MSEAKSPSSKGYPDSVKKILVIRPDGNKAKLDVERAESDSTTPRVSKRYRKIEREMRAFTHAAQEYLRDYGARHQKSASKKRNGSYRDILKNSFKASEKATDVLEGESRLYRKAKVPRRLHQRIMKIQKRTLT